MAVPYPDARAPGDIATPTVRDADRGDWADIREIVQAAYRPSQGMMNAMYGGQRMYGPPPQAPQAPPHGSPPQGGGFYDSMMNAARDAQARRQSFQTHGDLYYNPSLPVDGPPAIGAPQPNAPNMNGGYGVMPSARKTF